MAVPEQKPQDTHSSFASEMLEKRTVEERERRFFVTGRIFKNFFVGTDSLGTPDAASYFPRWCSRAKVPDAPHKDASSCGVRYRPGRFIVIFDASHERASSCGFQDCNLDCRMIRARTWRFSVYNAGLAVSQMVSAAVMGNYKLPIINYPASTCEPGPKMLGAQSSMLWPCAQVFKYLPSIGSQLNLPTHCGTHIPDIFIRPTPTIFILSAMGYGITCMLYYEQHRHHNYQGLFLTLGFLIGGMISLNLYTQDVPLNVVKTIIPTSMTVALIFSAIIHSIWQAFFPSMAERLLGLSQL